jgi:hypothetical protein
MFNNVAFAPFRSGFATGGLGLLLWMCVAAWFVSASAQESKLIILDAPGADQTPGNYNGTFPASINARGTITGSSADVNGVSHGFLRNTDGKFTKFDVPGAGSGLYEGTSPTSINDLGTIAGEYVDANGFFHGFLRAPNGKFTTFDVPGAGGYGTFPIALNLEGAVVGYYTDSNFVFYAFLRKPDGTFKTFAGPGACATSTSTGCFGNEATNIDASGTIVGNYMDGNFIGHGLIRRPDGEILAFDVPGAGSEPGSYQGTGCPGCSSGFNVRGEIAATYSDANNVNHGFVRDREGRVTSFDAPGAGTGIYQGTGCFSDCPVSLNNWGALTGVYIDANYIYHGYLRNPNGKITTIDPQGSTGTLPYSINDSGAVTGYYLDGNNVYHGFLRIEE